MEFKIDINQNELYSVPLKIKSSLKPSKHLVYIFMIMLFLSCFLILINDTQGIFIKFLSGVLVLFFLYIWLYVGVFKIGAVLLDNKHITLNTYLVQKVFDGQKSHLLKPFIKIAIYT